MPAALRELSAALGICLLAFSVGCQPAQVPEQTAQSPPAAKEPPTVPTATAPSPRTPEKLAASHLPNAFRVAPRLISGGSPEGDAAFQQLADLGIKTIISVDGAKPDVERAKKFGMRYVHLPHGYNGVPEQRGWELAKAVRDLPGPTYLHCHHGKHRSPAAAAVVCVELGLLDDRGALSLLEAAGTSPNYRGLFDSVRQARMVDHAVLDAVAANFPEIADLPPLAEAMVEIEHIFDRLKLFAAADWQPLAKHPDLDPAHEALLLREQFTELLRTDDTRQRPAHFIELTQQAEAAAQQLEDQLRAVAKPAAEVAAVDPAGIGRALDRVTQNCAACHREFRDVPLGGTH